MRLAVKNKDNQCVRETIRRILGSVRLGVERRLVGRVKHRYYLVGGDIVMQNDVEVKTGRDTTAAALYLSTENIEARGSGEAVAASVSLSPSEPTPFPR